MGFFALWVSLSQDGLPLMVYESSDNWIHIEQIGIHKNQCDYWASLNSHRTNFRTICTRSEVDIEKKYTPSEDDTPSQVEHKKKTLANIKANAKRMTHPVSQEVMLWIPTISLRATTEYTQEESRTREIESRDKVPKAKKAKTEQQTARPAIADGVLVPIPPSQLSRLEAQIPKLQEQHLAVNAALLDCKHDDIRGNIPPKTMAKASKTPQEGKSKLNIEAPCVPIWVNVGPLYELYRSAGRHVEPTWTLAFITRVIVLFTSCF